MRFKTLLPVLLLFPACSGGGGSTPAAERDVRIVVVTHGQASDPFWSVVANGVRAAERQLGVRAEYQAPTRFDMVEMSNLIDAAVASKPNGLIVSIPDAAALEQSIRRAVASGIPVISINSGATASTQFGLLAHVGQSEYEAGSAAGQRLASAGARKLLCINHEVGNAALDERCRGARDALTAAGATIEIVGVELANPDDAQQRIASALRTDPTIDAVLTLGPASAPPALAAVRAAGRSLSMGAFDLSPAVLEAIRDGHVLFAIDQQQYLQGYLPVVLLSNYLQTLTIPGGGKDIATGPGFVTREQAARVIELSTRGIR